jgi:hypothetical protein
LAVVHVKDGVRPAAAAVGRRQVNQDVPLVPELGTGNALEHFKIDGIAHGVLELEEDLSF